MRVPGHPLELPALFCERLARIVPRDRLEACWDAFRGEPATSLRINPLRSTGVDLVAELRTVGIDPAPLGWLDDVYLVPPEQRRALTETEAFAAGRLYVQNPASMVPPLALAPEPDDWVLDLAAAPGSKTLQLAALMGNQGRISAVESVRSRFHRLRRNVQTGGATNVITYLKDGVRVGRTCPQWFDRVLLDAPCSSEGRFRTDDHESYTYWSKRKIGEMARKQARLLYSAVLALKPSGTLVYSTCTFAPEENELVVDDLLRRLPGVMRIVPVGVHVPEAEGGLTSWDGRSVDPALAQAMRIVPNGINEGFFVCRLEKVASTGEL